MLVILIIAFFNTIVNSGFTFFIRSYMTFLGREPLDGAYVLGVMLLGAMIGCVVYGIVAHRVSQNKTLLMANITATIAFAMMLFSVNMVMIVVMMVIGSICVSINIPAMIAKANRIIPNDATSSTSFVFIGIVVGSVVGPPIIGWVGDLMDMRIALLAGVAMLIPIVVFAGRMLRQERLLKTTNLESGKTDI
jgi:MFS family permease